MVDPLYGCVLLNIPVRTPLGRELRDAFAQRQVLIPVDYASLEIRTLAQITPMTDLAALLLEASDQQLDAAAKAKIRTWDKPAKAVQVLEVLDMCVHGSLCSEFVILMLRTMLDQAIKAEGTTYRDVVAQATWREAPEHG